MFDAYTIKKVMPRLVAAAILIQLSWPLLTTAINVVTQLSWGLEGLLYAPFGGRSALDIGTTLELAGSQLGFTALLGGGLAWAGLGAPGLMALAIGILGAILVAFFTLAVRQVLIIVLVLTAPLALVAWILPNTEGLWKLWWGTFSKVLLMYPLILLLIASGRIAARLIAVAELPQLISLILVIVVFFLPFFLIAKTFQYAGGAISATANIIGSRSSKLSSAAGKRSSAKQAAKWGARKERADRNALVNPNRRFGGAVNTAASWAVNPMANARLKMGTTGGRALGSELTQKTVGQSKALAQWMSDAGLNQEALTEIMANFQQNKRFDAGALQARAQAMLANPGSTTQERAAANQLLRAAPYLNSVYTSEDFGRANIGMAAALSKSQQGFIDSSDPAETANYANFLNTMTPGLGDTYKTQSDLISGKSGGAGKVGYSTQVDTDGKYVAGGQAARSIQLVREGVPGLSSMKSKQFRTNFIDNGAMSSILNADTSDGKVAEFTDDATGEKLKLTDAMRTSTIETLMQTAYGYSTPSETSAMLKEQLANIEASGSDQLKREIQAARERASRVIDPDSRGMRPPPPPEE